MSTNKQPIPCRSCGAPIRFLESPAGNGKKIPVDAETCDERDRYYGKECGHISHFATCPAAQAHRRAR